MKQNNTQNNTIEAINTSLRCLQEALHDWDILLAGTANTRLQKLVKKLNPSSYPYRQTCCYAEWLWDRHSRDSCHLNE
jgi:hypothetical protein